MKLSASERSSIRWWPAFLILLIEAALLTFFWLGPMPSIQQRVVPTFPILFFSTLALFFWLVLFSRLPKRMRLQAFAVAVTLVGLGLLLLEIKGVDGNLVPIVGFRWSPQRDFGTRIGKGGEMTLPGSRDYPQFYGPHRDATLPGPRLARDWEAQPPEELWRRKVGEGWSAFAVVGNAAVTQEQRGDQEVVVRYELETGEQVWVHADRARFDTTVGGRGPRATPTIVNDRIYTLGATGILNCIDLIDGRRLWSRNVLAENDARQPDWGMASSPLVVGELVVVQLGLYGRSLAAYHRRSGELVWRAGTDMGSYSTPTVATVAGREQILSVNRSSVAGHDPTTGELLWEESWRQSSGEKVTPCLQIGEDSLLVSAGYGLGSRLLRIVPTNGTYVVEELWESRRLKSKFATMVLRDGVVYGLDDGVLVALDPRTGERFWKAGRYGHGQMILVRDLLLIQAENGQVVLVEATPDGHREVARLASLDSKTWNPPALSGRLLLVRNNLEAACYRLPIVK